VFAIAFDIKDDNFAQNCFKIKCKINKKVQILGFGFLIEFISKTIF
jgi:hypothetical protein